MKILIIAEYIAPVQEMASVRWTKIAKYLEREHEVEIHVVTTQKNYDDKKSLLPKVHRDGLLEKDMSCFSSYHMVEAGWRLLAFYWLRNWFKDVGTNDLGTQQLMNSSTGGWKSSFKRNVRLLVHDVHSWICAAEIKDYLRTIDLKKYDVVISSYGPIWPHLAAEYVAERKKGICWIADFRDPYAKEMDEPIAYKRHRAFTAKHCALASVITEVGQTETFAAPQQYVRTITNGYDPEEKLIPLPPEKFSIVFTGALYGERRDLGVIFRVLCDLQQEGMIHPQDVCVKYAGTDSSGAKAFAKHYHAEHFLEDYGVIPRSQALEMQRKAAILLQMNWNTHSEHCTWSGKMYEYMMMQKPIVFVVTGDEPHSFPSKNMERLGGICYEKCRDKEMYPILKQYIYKKYKEWKATGDVSVVRDEEYVAQYSYIGISEKLWKIIQEVKGR